MHTKRGRIERQHLAAGAVVDHQVHSTAQAYKELVQRSVGVFAPDLGAFHVEDDEETSHVEGHVP